MHDALSKLLNDFIAREDIIAAAVIGTDGLIIDSASHKNIDMDRIGALFGIYFANTAAQSQDIRVLQLPKQEAADYVFLGCASGALLALFTNSAFTETVRKNFENDIQQISLALTEGT